MPYPPPVLPINRTNADPQQDTHPNDHNALAQAMNDVTAHLTQQIDIWINTLKVQVVNSYGANGGGGIAGPGEVGACQLLGPAIGVPGRLKVWGLVYITKTVPTDVFRVELRDQGAALLQQASGDSGAGPAAQLMVQADVPIVGGQAIDVSMYVIPNPGSTGTATFTPAINRLDAIFIHDPSVFPLATQGAITP